MVAMTVLHPYRFVGVLFLFDAARYRPDGYKKGRHAVSVPAFSVLMGP